MNPIERKKIKSKIENLALLSFKNALRLHFDSIILYSHNSYPSAYVSSVLSLEEIGKLHLLNSDFMCNSLIEGNMKSIIDMLKLTYIHPIKQKNALDIEDYFCKNKRTGIREINMKFQHIFSGELEVSKQRAIYAGFDRIKGKIQINSPLRSPFYVKHTKTLKQIRLVHEYFLDMVIGTIKGKYGWDYDRLNEYLFHSGKDIYDQLKSQTLPLSSKVKKILENMEILDDVQHF